MPDVETHPLIDTLTALYCREGGAFENDDRDVHRARFAWEFASGQWVMVTSAADVLWGWASWYRTDDAGLRLLRDLDSYRIVSEEIPICLWEGPHVYVATALVAPWAPRATYRRLYELVKAHNRDALDISGHMQKRDGRTVFHTRRIGRTQ
jgi:hypothetical protein